MRQAGAQAEQVAHAVIDDRDHTSSPFVEGISSRWAASMATAAASAWPAPLKQASRMCSGRGDGFGTVDVGVKAAVEHDEQQRRAADGFGERVVAKVDVRRTVDAEQHAERNKDEEGGEGEFFADGFDGQAQNDDEADKEKYLVHG